MRILPHSKLDDPENGGAGRLGRRTPQEIANWLANGLNQIPGFAILLGEQLVGVGGIQELLVVAIPAQLAADLEGEVGAVRRAGRAVRGLNVGGWRAARSQSFQEVPDGRVV